MTDFTSTFRRTTYPRISPSANSQASNTVLVTGSSEGIGFNIAAAFVEAHASTVILVSRTQAKLDVAAASLRARNSSTTILTRVCDVASIDEIQQLWVSLADERLLVDVLVLNAGATEQPTSTAETIGSLQFAIGSNVVLAEAFRAQSNEPRRPRCLINMSSAGTHCYPGIGGRLSCSGSKDVADSRRRAGRQTIYHAGKAGFAAYIAHATEVIPEDEMRMVSLYVGPCAWQAALQVHA